MPDFIARDWIMNLFNRIAVHRSIEFLDPIMFQVCLINNLLYIYTNLILISSHNSSRIIRPVPLLAITSSSSSSFPSCNAEGDEKQVAEG